MLGGIQPGPLKRYLREVFAGRRDGGLLQRLQLAAWPNTRSSCRGAKSIETSILAQIRAEVPERIRATSARLEEVLQAFNPLDVMAHGTLAELFIDPERYSESTHQGRQAHVECLALFCLKKQFHDVEAQTIAPDSVNTILTLIRHLCAALRAARYPAR